MGKRGCSSPWWQAPGAGAGLLLLVCGVMAALFSCGRHAGERYVGPASVCQVIPNSALVASLIVQYDRYSGEYDASKRRPLFGIVWKGRNGGSDTTNTGNQIVEINGHPITVSFRRSAVYALQPDYTLREIPLALVERDHVLGLVESPGGIVNDGVWKAKITPYLQTLTK